jgi:gamma-glutamyltranspeptidase/glutathione hydrolase/leukotriene-C4 hydrolase
MKLKLKSCFKSFYSDILVDGGNAVDAAVATIFCIGAVNPQSAGIGGGFHMTIYDPAGPQARSLDAREVAPIAATEDMFKGNSSISQRGTILSYNKIAD